MSKFRGSEILTQLTLGSATCDEPGCGCSGRMYLHSACHQDVPMWASYENGVLVLECAECGKPAAKIAVAP